MEPKSLSATALQVFEMCPARYKAESIDRTKGFGGFAANLGSSVHGALENYVKLVYLDGNEQPSLKLLLEMFKLSYSEIFNSHDYETEEFADGQKMLADWFSRTDFTGVTVRSVEIKSNFPVPTSLGPLPFNYIWDRFDQIGERQFKVVDYKSNRWDIQPSDLKKKIQARAYGLACAIQLKTEGIEYDRIWVEFDMLRYGTRGISFSREENAATWNYIKRSAQEIVDTPDKEFIGGEWVPVALEERLNDQCLFCVRKAQCGALKKNIVAGGIHSIGTIEEAIDLRAMLEFQRKGLDSLIKDMDAKILTEARERDLEEYESDLTKLTVGVSSKRAVDAELVQLAIGEDLFHKYGSASITMASVDKLLKGGELDDKQKQQLRGLIYQQRGNPRVKVETKNPIDED